MTIQLHGGRAHTCAAVCLTVAVLFNWNAYAEEHDSARQLVQLTSLDNILRTDSEQAGFMTDRLSNDLPPQLRSDLGRAIDSLLDYNKMEDALVKTARMDRTAIDLNSRWRHQDLAEKWQSFRCVVSDLQSL
jgi:hypothetical protein